MFVVNNPNRSIAPLQSTNATSNVEGPAEASGPATTREAPAVSPFASSSFQVAQTNPVNLGGAQPGQYWPTNAELQRPTTAAVVNITNGERQGLNPVQMSTEQGVNFVQQRLAALGFQGSLTASNTTSPTTGPFRIDYGNDDRRHWDIGGMNIGLIQNLYANNPPHVADAMLMADMQHARRGPASWEEEGTPRIPANLTVPFQSAPAAPSQPTSFRILPGTTPRPTPTSGVAPTQPQGAAGSSYFPTREDVNRPTTAVSLNILTGERVGLNPQQMSAQEGVDFVRERLRELGYRGPGSVSNQTAPTSGPFGIDYGTDNRRHWDIDGMNVGLTLNLYANNPREVADRMLADIIRNQMPRNDD